MSLILGLPRGFKHSRASPACGETSHDTSLGAVALTGPRSLLRFSFRNELPCSDDVRVKLAQFPPFDGPIRSRRHSRVHCRCAATSDHMEQTPTEMFRTPMPGHAPETTCSTEATPTRQSSAARSMERPRTGPSMVEDVASQSRSRAALFHAKAVQDFHHHGVSERWGGCARQSLPADLPLILSRQPKLPTRRRSRPQSSRF